MAKPAHRVTISSTPSSAASVEFNYARKLAERRAQEPVDKVEAVAAALFAHDAIHGGFDREQSWQRIGERTRDHYRVRATVAVEVLEAQ